MTPSYSVVDPASVILTKRCIANKESHDPETECVYFVDTNDITDNENFFEDETEVIELDSLPELNLDLGDPEPLNLDTLARSDPNLIRISLWMSSLWLLVPISWLLVPIPCAAPSIPPLAACPVAALPDFLCGFQVLFWTECLAFHLAIFNGFN
ncbi:hypothetical protein MA16_Dca006522 [Dendrobium catenatum]|uniref:Uncharacterized protein n=1 Tax=Dendrobium catenatum TaxID=906689 RepID=A0A2I0XGV3_9ASPA|nr:hypothetical protein MA16_Dca006522 [Dendrobium catenatum]